MKVCSYNATLFYEMTVLCQRWVCNKNKWCTKTLNTAPDQTKTITIWKSVCKFYTIYNFLRNRGLFYNRF